jgi:PAS domain S-box-containing protein
MITMPSPDLIQMENDQTASCAAGASDQSSLTENRGWPRLLSTPDDLRLNGELLQQILDSVESIIVTLDLHGNLTLINLYGAELLGFTPRQIIGKSWFENFLYPSVREEVRTVFQKMLEGHLGANEHVENEILTSRGERKSIAWHNTILRDSEGRITGMLSSGRDVTRKRELEASFLSTNQELRRVQSFGQIGSWQLDSDGMLTWSEEIYRIFEIPAGQLMSYTRFLDCVHPDDRVFVDKHWTGALRGEAYDIEHRILVNGREKWIRERAELEFSSDGDLIHAFGTAQDITDRKLAQLSLNRPATA